MNIIICDDRIDDRKNLSDLLSDYGEKKNYEFTITEYESGEQLCEEQSALEACQLDHSPHQMTIFRIERLSPIETQKHCISNSLKYNASLHFLYRHVDIIKSAR